MIDDKNFLVFIALSIAILLAWTYFVVPTAPTKPASESAPSQSETTATPDMTPQVGAPGTTPAGGETTPSGEAPSQSAAPVSGPRIAIDTPSLVGSIALKGARLNELKLKKYRETTDPDSPLVELLTPGNGAYFAEFGWSSPSQNIRLPTEDTLWTADTDKPLTPDNPVRLAWDNGAGLKFIREIAVDDDYMFTVKQRVENYGAETVELSPYGVIQRHGTPKSISYALLHEGFVGVANGKLQESNYDDFDDEPPISLTSTGGWLGITDKYWMTALIPDQGKPFQGRFLGKLSATPPIYQADYLLGAQSLAPGGSIDSASYFFAGAKKNDILNAYGDKLGIVRFDLAIDWGYFGFLTKPLFLILDYFGQLTGNFGIAILIVTVIIKLILFPLANKSYVAMSKMKKLQPKMAQIKERYPDDKVKQQQELMDLYRKEKVNPAAGCLPMIVQIPILFSLYKVLVVTIDMRGTPFFGWIKDLSAPDPTSVFNLFGLIPWQPPEMLMIGGWPLIMGLTMLIQTKLNPAPADPVQEKIFLFMPLIFMVMFAQFSAGLVIYWAWNNALSILQQYVIMRRMGVEVHLIDRFSLPGFKSRSAEKLSDDTAKAKSASEPAVKDD